MSKVYHETKLLRLKWPTEENKNTMSEINLGFWETAHLPLPYATVLP